MVIVMMRRTERSAVWLIDCNQSSEAMDVCVVCDVCLCDDKTSEPRKSFLCSSHDAYIVKLQPRQKR